VARSISVGATTEPLPPGFGLLNAIKKVQVELRQARPPGTGF
jgi:hypothetical protein